MAVSVLIVLGNKVRPGIDELSLEQWFMSYIGKNGCISNRAYLNILKCVHAVYEDTWD